MHDPVFSIRAGQVVHSFPALNCHHVKIPGIGTVTAIYGGSGSDTLLGHKAISSPMIGSWVVVVCPPTEDNTGTDHWPFVILSGLPTGSNLALNVDGETTDAVFARYSLSAVQEALDPVQAGLVTPRLQDYGFNVPDDTPPGSTLWANFAGGQLLFSDFLAQLGSSSRSYLRCNGVDRSTELRGDSLLQRTQMLKEYLGRRGSLSYHQRAIAADIVEAFGAGAGLAAVKQNDDGSYELVDTGQRTFSRRLTLEGGVVEGTWDQLRGRNSGTATLYLPDSDDTAKSTLLPMFSEQRSYDGCYRLRAAREISFERRALGIVVETLEDPRASATSTPDADPDTDEIYKRLGFANWGEYNVTRHLLDYRDDDADYAGRYPVLHKDQQLFRVTTAADLKAAIAPDTELKLPVLAGASAQYEPTQLPNIELPEDTTKKLLLLASMFRMLPTGDIVISDAYGSEIRLCSGRLIISAPVSVEIQSGRDVLVQAPRSLALKAARHAELSVTGGDVIVKAETNMHLLGGNGGTGATVIENRANATALSDITEDSVRKALARGSGVITRSRSGIANYSRYQFHSGYNDSAQASTKGCSSGVDVLVNAGVHHTQAATITAVAEQGIHQALHNGSAVLSLSSLGVICATAGNVTFGATQVQLDTVRASVPMPWIDDSGYGQHGKIQVSGSSPDLVVQGDIAIKGNGVMAGTLNISDIRSRKGINGEHADSFGNLIALDVPASQQRATAGVLQSSFSSALAAANRYFNSYGYSDRGQVMCSTAFPTSDAPLYPRKNWYQIQAKWQSLLDSTLKWRERDVTHAIVGKTQPFPGKEAQERKGSLLGYDGDAFTEETLNDYPVNYS